MIVHRRRRSPIAVALVLAAAVAGGCARPVVSPPAPAPLVAPDSFVVAFETSVGRFDVIARRALAPVGVDRFHALVSDGFFDGARFFRVVADFVVQFGIPADTAVAAAWHGRRIDDDSVRASNARGTIAFAHGGPGTRTTQLFINLRDNPKLDTLGTVGFPPFGEVVGDGMAVVDSLYGGYGEGAPRGRGPSQDSIRLQGEPYLARDFPLLDRIIRARIVRQ
ncbi:MAG: peptidylprolyl isomerase [Gemmatimonadaceae bacterium]